MAFEVEEKKSFLDNLQQAVGIGSQVAQVAGQFKQLQQTDKRLDLEKQDMLQRKDYFAAQAQHFKALQERQAFEMDQMRQAVKQKSAGYVFGQIANMVDMYGDIQDEKLRSSAFDGFLQNNGQFLADAGKQAGFETANDPMKFNDFLKNRAKAIAPFMVGMRNDENNLLKQISMPDQVWKAEEAANLLQTYTKSARKVIGQLPPDMAEVIEKNLDDMRKQIDDKNARISKAKSAETLVGIRGAANPSLGMDPGLRKFEMDQGTELSKQVKLIPSLERQEANINDILPLLDKVGTGPIKGQPAVYFAQKLGNEDAQKLQSFVSAAGIDRVVEMASQAGARAIDSDAERKFLMDSLANLQQNPGVIRDILARQQQILRYSRDLAAAKRQHKAKGGRFIDFEFPSLSEYMSGGSDKIQGMNPPQQPALTPQAPSNAMRQFLIEDE